MRFKKHILSILLVGCLQTEVYAETAPAKPCPFLPDSNGLKKLAQLCAKDLSLDANCRAHSGDYVTVRDCSKSKPAGYLFIPVPTVTGVEDPQIFSPSFMNVWKDAWSSARKYPGEPEARTGLAVNSQNARSQHQLHIHMSCVLPEVSQALKSAGLSSRPFMLELGPHHNAYQAMKVKSLTDTDSPFKLAQILPGEMKDKSIAVIGSENPGEFYVVSTRSEGMNRGHAEELLEQSCKP